MTEEKHMTINEAVAKVQRSVVVPKARYNAHGKFSYRSLEDVEAALKKPCEEAGVVYTLNDSIVMVGDRHYVKATVRLSFADGAEGALEVDGFAHEPDAQTGMNPSQVTGSASTYARKYALCGMFAIEGQSDPDALADKPAKEPPAQGPFVAKCKACGTAYEFASREQYEAFKKAPGCCATPTWTVV